MNSLLGTFYSRIKSSPEDIATESLCYILNKSSGLRRTFTLFLYNQIGAETNIGLIFKTQVSGENHERPDLVGYNNHQQEVVIGEMKFWAGLTSNQPVEYLGRLSRSAYKDKKILFFLCPDLRIPTLRSEIFRRCKDSIHGPELVELPNKSLKWNDVHIVIVSWDQVLDVLKDSLTVGESVISSDLDQLSGLKNALDSASFMPITEEDMAPAIGKRILSYYKLVDKVAEVLKVTYGINSKGFKSTPQYGGYTKYMRKDNIAITLNLSFNNWSSHGDTPIWLGIKEITSNDWRYSQHFRDLLKEYEIKEPKNLFVDDWGYILY
jgi:hypothetical protein